MMNELFAFLNVAVVILIAILYVSFFIFREAMWEWLKNNYQAFIYIPIVAITLGILIYNLPYIYESIDLGGGLYMIGFMICFFTIFKVVECYESYKRNKKNSH